MTVDEAVREVCRLALEHRTDLGELHRCRLIRAAEPELAERVLGRYDGLAASPWRRRLLLDAYGLWLSTGALPAPAPAWRPRAC